MNPLLAAVAVLLLLVYLFLRANQRPLNFPPGPPSLPIYGSYWFLLFNNYNYMHKAIHNMALRYRTKVVGFYLGDNPSVAACDSESIREMLSKPEFQGRPDNFVTRERQLRKLIGVFFVEGSFWKYQRRHMLRHMRDFGFGCRSAKQESLVQQQIQDILDVLKGNKEDKEVFRNGYALVPNLFSHIFLNTLWDIFCGNSFTHDNHSASRNLSNQGFRFHRNTDPTGAALTITPWIRHFAPAKSGFHGLKSANNEMLNALQVSIDEHLATYSEDHIRDFVDIFIKEMKEQENNFEPTPFVAEQLLITGLDLVLPTLTTVTAQLAFAVQLLLRHPEVQKKVQKELDTVVGRDRLPTLNDRPRLPYTEATLREIMRRKPILPLGVTHRAMEDGYLCGYFIPKGTSLFTSLYSLHKDPDIWGDPKVFRPERFLDEHGQLQKKDYSLPFGAGKRLCAGETFARNNMFLIFASLLQNCSFVMSKGGKESYTKPIPGLVLGPKEFWVKTEIRN